MNQTDIDNFIKEYKEIQETFNNKANESLLRLLESFWEINPTINLITWVQYAPYFNDRDVCTFSARSITLSNAIEKEDIDDIQYDEYQGDNPDIWVVGDTDYYNSFRTYKINKEIVKLLFSFISTLEKLGILRQMFGEDSKVIITRDGITVEDFSDYHD